jgi:hypothetical protein
MKCLKLLCLLVCFTPFGLAAQQYWSKRYDLQDGNDEAFKLAYRDSSFIVEGFGLCYDNNENCFGYMGLNYEGNLMWKSVVADSLRLGHPQSFDLVNDTIFANASYPAGADSAYTILAMSTEGQYLYRRDYHQAGVAGYHRTGEIVRYADRIFVSYDYRDTTTLKNNAKIRAYDLSWNILWEAVLPATNHHISWQNMEPTPDSGVVVIYSYISNGKRAAVERYNKYGERLWVTYFEMGYGILGNFVTLAAHPNGSYFGTWNIDYFTGNPNKNSYPDILFKLDASGHFVWQKLQQDKWENFSRIFVAQNGDVIGCGAARNKPSSNPDTYLWQAGYVRRMNTDGEEIWDRRIIDSTGGGYGFSFNYGLELDNGDLAFCGKIYSDTSATTQMDAWIVKTDPNGCLTPGCQDTFQILVPSKEAPGYREPDIFSLLPNPFTERLVLGTLLGFRVPAGDYEAAVYDLQGRVVQAPRRIDPDLLTVFDMAAAPAGMYVVQVFRDGRAVQALKAVKE